VKSATKDPRLVYWISRRYEAPILQGLREFEPGFNDLGSDREERGLDFIRGNIVDLKKANLADHDVAGPDNDVIDYITPILDQAISHQATIYIFGEPYVSKDGIHDVHMNQGNSEKRSMSDNGVWQDGGIILHFPDEHWESIFLAFAVQKVHTDDHSGNPIGNLDFATFLGGVVASGLQSQIHQTRIRRVMERLSLRLLLSTRKVPTGKTPYNLRRYI
jgi:uncharacterized protein YukJ